MYCLFQAEENLGMVVIFTLYSAVQEKLTEMVETHAQKLEDEREEARKAIEEAEKVGDFNWLTFEICISVICTYRHINLHPHI